MTTHHFQQPINILMIVLVKFYFLLTPVFRSSSPTMLSADILVEGVIGGGAAIGGRRAGVSTEVELARGEVPMETVEG